MAQTAPKAKSCLFHQLYEFRSYSSSFLYSDIYSGSRSFQVVVGLVGQGKFTSLQQALTAAGSSANPETFPPLNKSQILKIIHSFEGLSYSFSLNGNSNYNESGLPNGNVFIVNNVNVDFSSDNILKSQNFQKRITGTAVYNLQKVSNGVNVSRTESYGSAPSYLNSVYNINSSTLFSFNEFLKSRINQIDPLSRSIFINQFSEYQVESSINVVSFGTGEQNNQISVSSEMEEINANMNISGNTQLIFIGTVNSNFDFSIAVKTNIIEFENSYYLLVQPVINYNSPILRSQTNNTLVTCNNFTAPDKITFELVQKEVGNYGFLNLTTLTQTNFPGSNLGIGGEGTLNFDYSLGLELFEYSDFSPDYNYPTRIQ